MSKMVSCIVFAALSAGLGLQGCSPASHTPASVQKTAGGTMPAAPIIRGVDSGSTTAPLSGRLPAATIDDADTMGMALLFYSLQSQRPPLEEWASADAERQTSNEIDRAKIEPQLLASYRGKLDNMSKVGGITLHISSNLSDYDSANSEFYIVGFAPGTVYSYDNRGSQFKVSFTNGEAAQHFRLSQADAVDLLKKTHNSHAVAVTVHTEIVSSDPQAYGGDIHVKILSYQVEDDAGSPLAKPVAMN